jgi:hypothetical protein
MDDSILENAKLNDSRKVFGRSSGVTTCSRSASGQYPWLQDEPYLWRKRKFGLRSLQERSPCIFS